MKKQDFASRAAECRCCRGETGNILLSRESSMCSGKDVRIEDPSDPKCPQLLFDTHIGSDQSSFSPSSTRFGSPSLLTLYLSGTCQDSTRSSNTASRLTRSLASVILRSMRTSQFAGRCLQSSPSSVRLPCNPSRWFSFALRRLRFSGQVPVTWPQPCRWNYPMTVRRGNTVAYPGGNQVPS